MFNLGLKRSLIEEIRHIFLFDLFIEDNLHVLVYGICNVAGLLNQHFLSPT